MKNSSFIAAFLFDGLAIVISVVTSYAFLYLLSVVFNFVIEQPSVVLLGQTITTIFIILFVNFIWNLAIQTNVLNEEIEKAKTLIKAAEKKDEALKDDDTKSDKDNDDWAA